MSFANRPSQNDGIWIGLAKRAGAARSWTAITHATGRQILEFEVDADITDTTVLWWALNHYDNVVSATIYSLELIM